jgi:hypothetical protein
MQKNSNLNTLQKQVTAIDKSIAETPVLSTKAPFT